MIEDSKKTSWSFLVYIVAFFAFWAASRIWIDPGFKTLSLANKMILTDAMKILIWVLPVILYLKYIDGEQPLAYLKLNKNVKAGFKWGLFLSFVFIVVRLGRQYFFGHLEFKLDFGLESLISSVVITGFTEEIVFRGFILQKLTKLMEFWKSNIISSILFVVIHFPSWFMQGKLFIPTIGGAILFIFIIGFFQGYVLKKTYSLWPCIIIHSTNNFLAIITGTNW